MTLNHPAMRLSRLVPLALVAACAGSRAAPRSSRGPQRCDGQQFVEVDNPLGRTVDVYASVDDGGSRFIGTASGGISRIPVSGRVATPIAMLNGVRVDTPNSAATAHAPVVRSKVVCESP